MLREGHYSSFVKDSVRFCSLVVYPKVPSDSLIMKIASNVPAILLKDHHKWATVVQLTISFLFWVTISHDIIDSRHLPGILEITTKFLIKTMT